MTRDLVDRDDPTLLCVEFADEPSFAVEDLAHDRRSVIAESAEVGKVADQQHVDREGSGGSPDGGQREKRDENANHPAPATPRPD